MKLKQFKSFVIYWIKYKILKLAIKYINYYSKDSNYVKHAKKEMDFAWPRMKEKNKDEDNTLQLHMCNDIISLLSLLSTQDDSGSTIHYKLNLFNKLAKFDIIGKLTFKDSEFTLVDIVNHLHQNQRCSAVFRCDKGYSYVDAFRFKAKYKIISELSTTNEKTESCPSLKIIAGNDIPWSGGLFTIDKQGNIKYFSKTYIKDINTWNKDKFTLYTYELEYPNDWFISFVKESDLDAMKEVYNISFNNNSNELLKKEIEFQEGKHKDEILNRINVIYRHMYDLPITYKITNSL